MIVLGDKSQPQALLTYCLQVKVGLQPQRRLGCYAAAAAVDANLGGPAAAAAAAVARVRCGFVVVAAAAAAAWHCVSAAHEHRHHQLACMVITSCRGCGMQTYGTAWQRQGEHKIRQGEHEQRQLYPMHASAMQHDSPRAAAGNHQQHVIISMNELHGVLAWQLEQLHGELAWQLVGAAVRGRQLHRSINCD
jgi:hypothetical protein